MRPTGNRTSSLSLDKGDSQAAPPRKVEHDLQQKLTLEKNSQRFLARRPYRPEW